MRSGRLLGTCSAWWSEECWLLLTKKDLPHRLVWSVIAEVMGSGAAAAMLVASAVEGNSFGYGLFVGYMAQKWEVPKMLGKYWQITHSHYPDDY